VRRFVYSTIVLALSMIVSQVNAQDSSSATSLYNDGLALIKEKKYEEGYPMLQQAIETADTTTESGQKVIKLAKRNAAIAAYYVGNKQRKGKAYEDAIATYTNGIDYAPGFYANYIGLAQAFEGKGDVEAAIGAYLEASTTCKKAKKEEKAVKMLSKAENIVAVAWGDKNWANTAAYATAYLAGKEDNAEVEYYLAYAMKEQAKTDEAIAHIDKAIALSGDEVDDKYYMVKAEALEKAGKNAEAIAAYEMIKGAKYSERAAYKIKELGGE
jgi:tetratricopeptide (TPR) repeat protein